MTQTEALAILESGQNVLLTGAAGTGKTYLLRKFIKRARQQGKSVAVTATTGLAATHLNGTTIHAWSGIGVRDELEPDFADRASQQRLQLVREADILVIDEISMLHDYRLDMVDQALRGMRDDPAPFGGAQVVLCGDFFQLPPVNRRDSRQGGFITGSAVWQDGSFSVCYLEQQYRQAKDTDYTELLNGIRAGVLSRNQLDSLRERQNVEYDPWATYTRLLTVNVDVDAINEQALDALEGEVQEYTMSTSGGKQYVEQLMRSCLAPEVLRLKINAHVMCIKNSADRRYANGSLGVVKEFDSETGYPVIELISGRTIVMAPDTWELMDGDRRRAQLTQLPLRLAWAITVHKSQGMTLDAARVDLSKAFVEGMGYVALSRVRGMEHLMLDGMNSMALRVSGVAREIDGDLRARSAAGLAASAAWISEWQAAEERGEHQAVEQTVDTELLSRLKTRRSDRCRNDGVPPYIIAHDAVLEAIASRRPADAKALARIKGMGPKKVALYGPDILALVQ